MLISLVWHGAANEIDHSKANVVRLHAQLQISINKLTR
jgi:hypothetical protein